MDHISPGCKPLVRHRRPALQFLLMAGLFLMPCAASAQSVQDRVDAVSAHMKHINSLVSKMTDAQKAKLSSSAQHLVRMAAHWDSDLQSALAGTTTSAHAPLSGHPFSPSGTLGGGQVSDPSTDLAFSRLAGFVQSETSTAWCGRHVVVAYNDSGSLLETFPIPNIGLSFNGYSLSTDGGKTFTDEGYLNPGPNFFASLSGDPGVVCTDENTFYQSSIFSSGFSDTGVSVSASTDGGASFAPPVEVVSKDLSLHFIDKPWMAADPSNPKKLYVTYTDFDFSGFFDPSAICPGNIRLGIELVRSTDGGATWSAPTVVDAGCSPNTDQGSNVAVDGKGNVFVAWEQFPAFLPTNEIDIAKSTNGGATFGPKTTVAIVTVVGHNFFGLLQGGFRNNEFPSLAIDRSQGPSGPLYLTWNDARFGTVSDGFPPFFSGITYGFGDVLVSRSNNGGATWSSAVKVNSNKGAASLSAPVDHYLPGIAVDQNGTVGVCWYDRRRDPANFLIDRECAHSRNGGVTWKNHRVTNLTFSPIIADDQLVNPLYMGDYDTTAADILGHSSGFLGAFGDNSRGNPDVSISRRFGSGDDDNNDDD